MAQRSVLRAFIKNPTYQLVLAKAKYPQKVEFRFAVRIQADVLQAYNYMYMLYMRFGNYMYMYMYLFIFPVHDS